MITNRDLVKYGRELEQQRVTASERVTLMARLSVLRDQLHLTQETIKMIEKEIGITDQKLRDSSQVRLEFNDSTHSWHRVGSDLID